MKFAKSIFANNNHFLRGPDAIFHILAQIYFSYFFLGQILFSKDLAFLSRSEFLIPICSLGLIFQIVFIATSTTWSGMGILLCWYALYYVNPFIAFVSYLIFGFFFLTLLLTRMDLDSRWGKTKIIECFVWFLAFHYFFSGFYKLRIPEWLSGEALPLIFRPPVARDWLYVWVQESQNFELMKSAGFAVILIEMFCLLLIIKKSRRFLLAGLFLFHLVLASSLSILQLTVPYFIIILWLLKSSSEKGRFSS